MRAQLPNATDLLRTQAEQVPPPDVTVPEPQSPPTTEPIPAGVDPKLLAEVKTLSERVGGLKQLRELVDALLRFQR